MSEVAGPLTDQQAMTLAIEEAKRGAGFVSPNPLVGCVILDSKGYLLSKGYHPSLGKQHAEIDALNKLPDPSLLNGAQVFVTLEPCAHQGKTPSCAKHLAQLPIKRVMFGLEDPNPLVSGKGVEILIAAGITVDRSEGLDDELEELAEIFLLNMRQRRAWVTLKVASSLDGQVALANGESQWITCEASREKVQWLRGVHDAILVGAGTVLKDNPTLNIRHPHFAEKMNKVVIVDPRAETLASLPTSKLYEAHQASDIFIVLNWEQRSQFKDKALHEECERLAQESIGVVPKSWIDPERGWNYIFPSVTVDSRIDLIDMCEQLFTKGVCSIFCEGGSKVFSSFLQQRAADRLILFQSLSILGAGMGWGSGFSISSLKDRLLLSSTRTEQSGDDLMITGRLASVERAPAY